MSLTGYLNQTYLKLIMTCIKKIIFVAFLGLNFFMLSCNEEEENVTPDLETEEEIEIPACIVTKTYNNSYYIENIYYNPDGTLDKIEYTDENEVLEDFALHTYNESGEIEKVEYFIANDVNTATRYNEIEYNADGKIAKILNYDDADSGYELESSEVFSYDSDKKLIKVDYLGSTGELELHYTFEEYDQEGNFLTVKLYDYVNGEAEIRSIREYTYDDKPNAYLSLGGFVYGYDVFTSTPNNIIKVTDTDGEGNPTGEGYIRTFEYNENGFPVKHTDEYDDSPGNEYYVFYEYDCK